MCVPLKYRYANIVSYDGSTSVSHWRSTSAYVYSISTVHKMEYLEGKTCKSTLEMPIRSNK